MRRGTVAGWLTLLALVASTTPVGAQDREAVFNNEIDNIYSQTLENGLEVVVIEDHSLPIVAIEIAVHSGAMVEPPDLNGLSHLYEHMFFKGNEAIPSQEAYLARQRELGMTWNGTTSEERVNYFFTLGSERLCDGLVFMSNAIRTPIFDGAELERERVVVLGEVDRNEASPFYHLRQAVEEAIWGENHTRKDALGDRETISTATADQMRFLQQTYYVPNNSALFLAGDVTPEEGFALAEQTFGQWERGPDPFDQRPLPEIQPLASSGAEVVEQDVQLATVMIAQHGPSVTGDVEATFAADVFSYILSQPAHRFQHNLVDSGLLLGVGLSYYTQDNVGPIYLSGQLVPTNLEPALRAMREEIQHFTDPDYFTDEQLETAKVMLAVSELYSRQQTTGWVHTVSFWWAVAGLDYYRNYVHNLQAVTRDDIVRYVETYIQGKPFYAGVLVSPQVREAMGLTADQILAWFGEDGEPTTPEEAPPTAP